MLLKDFVNMKLASADKEASAEGYPLKMENCKKYKKMRDLKVYGNSFQDGTPTLDAPVEVVSVGDKSVNLFDSDLWLSYFDKLEDGSYHSNITIRPEHRIPFSLKAGTYTVSLDVKCPKNCRYRPWLADANGNLIYNFAVPNNDTDNWYSYKYTFSSKVDVAYMYFSYNINSNDVYFRNFQIQEGSTATPYEPYGKYKIPVVSRGINLLDISNATRIASYSAQNITFTDSGVSWITTDGYSNVTLKIGLPSEYAGKTLTMSSPSYYKSPATQLILFNGSSILKQGTSYLNNGNGLYYTTITINESDCLDEYFLCLRLYCIGQSVGNFIEFENIMLAESDTPKAYEPYIEPVTTNIFLDEPLHKLGDYADYIDFKENKAVRNVGELNGEQIVKYNIMKYSSASYSVVNAYRFVAGVLSTNNRTLKLVCSNMFAYGKYVANEALTSIGYSEGGFVYFRFDGENNYGVTDVATCRSFLTTYNPLIYFVRYTPTEEPIALNLPKLTAKTTLIEVDTSLASSNIYGKYIKK